MKKAILTICLMSLFSFAATAEEKEPILSLGVENDGITFEVRSGGGTRKEHFSVVKSNNDLSLQRHTPDYRKANLKIAINYSFEELGMNEGNLFTIETATSFVNVQRKHMRHGFFCEGSGIGLEYSQINGRLSSVSLRRGDAETLKFSQQQITQIFTQTHVKLTMQNVLNIIELHLPAESINLNQFDAMLSWKTMNPNVGGIMANDPNMHAASGVKVSCKKF